MRITLEGKVVHFYRDVGTHSCGESRSEWERIGTVSLERLVHALQRLVLDQKKDARKWRSEYL